MQLRSGSKNQSLPIRDSQVDREQIQKVLGVCEVQLNHGIVQPPQVQYALHRNLNHLGPAEGVIPQGLQRQNHI